MLSPRLLVLTSALLSACSPKGEGADDAPAEAGEITLGQLCKHFVQISSDVESDQVAKRDRKEDYAECMASFPAMESQLKGAERENFRACAMKATTVETFTACAPSLFKPAPPDAVPPEPHKVG